MNSTKKSVSADKQKIYDEKIKVAILNHDTVSNNISGLDKYINRLARSLHSYSNKIIVNTFVFSSKNQVIYNGTYTENEIKEIKYPKGGYSAARIIDFLALFTLGIRPTIEKTNRNKRFILSLEKFNPDVIIDFDLTLSKLLANYKNRNPKVKIIFEYDSYKQIYNIADAIQVEENFYLKNLCLNPIKKLFYRKYVTYYMMMYQQMLDIADKVIMASDRFLKEVGAEFPRYKNKLSIIPGVIARNAYNIRIKKISTIKTILFVGGCQNPPNKQAIYYIENIIAPYLPDYRFIIAGIDCPKKNNIRNIKFLGQLKEKELYSRIQKADICIAPLTLGTGMKAKILDYLLQGKAILGTELAFEGYGIRNNINGFIENNIDRFPRCIMLLSKNIKLVNKVCKNAKKTASNFKNKHIVQKWLNVIFDILQN